MSKRTWRGTGLGSIGGRTITLDAVADAVGVSRATVSNAYNRPDQLSDALRQRILATALKMGYAGPDPAARSLRRGVTESIGVALTETLSYAFSDTAAIAFLHGLARRTEAVGMSLLLIPESPRQDAAAVRDAIVDGFVVYSMPDDDDHVAAIIGRQLPVVFVDQPAVPDANFVGIDNRAATRELMERLLEGGHRRLAVVSFPIGTDQQQGSADLTRQAAVTRAVTRERLTGYREAVEAAGLDWREVHVQERLRSDESEGYEAGMAILSASQRPSAVVAMSDHLALGVMAAARSMGVRIPEDLSVTGFDDIPAAGASRPGLTTVRQPLAEKGDIAADILLRLLSGRIAEEPEVHILPTSLVVRGSSQPARRSRRRV